MIATTAWSGPRAQAHLGAPPPTRRHAGAGGRAAPRAKAAHENARRAGMKDGRRFPAILN
jgi:hypothetical protein